jgi:hypothetical protein
MTGEDDLSDAPRRGLALARAAGEIALTGNRESWSTLQHDGEAWVIRRGDTGGGGEWTDRVSPMSAWSELRSMVRDRLGIHGPDRGEPADEVILDEIAALPALHRR